MKDDDPLRGHTYEDGLHKLKDEWCQKSYIGAQSAHLTDNLKAAIEKTFSKAPHRRGSFQLGRPTNENINARSRERIWERSLLKHWEKEASWSVPRCWSKLVGYQVPLAEPGHTEKGWGDIDLLGVNNENLPVVVELKKDPRPTHGGRTDSSETPMRMVLEGWAYAIALQKSWSNFREEFRAASNIEDELSESIKTVPIVAAAPAAFWIDWLPVTDKGRSVTLADWKLFKNLLDAMSTEGFPVSFLSISGDADNPDSLAAQPLTEFPLLTIPDT